MGIGCYIQYSLNDYFADQLRGYTEKLVFSFADISIYRKVGRNLSEAGVNYREWTEDEIFH